MSIVFAARQPHSASPFTCAFYNLMFYVRSQIVCEKERYGTALTIDNGTWISTRIARISPHCLDR